MALYVTMTDPSGARQEIAPGLANELLAQGWKFAKPDTPLDVAPALAPEPSIPAPAATSPAITAAVEQVVGKPSIAEEDKPAETKPAEPTPQAKDAAPRSAPSAPARGASPKK